MSATRTYVLTRSAHTGKSNAIQAKSVMTNRSTRPNAKPTSETQRERNAVRSPKPVTAIYKHLLTDTGTEIGRGSCGAALDGSLKAELQRLRHENKRLLMEREILKKATAFFAKEQP
jgi:5-methylthioribose kinase